MIRTKNIEEFLKVSFSPYGIDTLTGEYIEEIVTRLEELDRLRNHSKENEQRRHT